MELQQGANTAVSGATLTVRVEFSAPGGCEVDVSAFVVGENGRVRGDEDMVFYNQPNGADGAVRLTDRGPGGTTFEVDAPRLAAQVAKVVFTATIDQAQARRQTLAMLSYARSVVRSGGSSSSSDGPPAPDGPGAGASQPSVVLMRRSLS